MIYVARPTETLDLIFFKLMFYFDEFQPGKTRFWNPESSKKKPILPFDFEVPEGVVKKLAIKSNETDDHPVICMAHVFDPDDSVCAIIMTFPLMPYVPQLIIKQTNNGVGLGCDEGGRNLTTDMSKSEAREAFTFFIEKIKVIVAECTGN